MTQLIHFRGRKNIFSEFDFVVASYIFSMTLVKKGTQIKSLRWSHIIVCECVHMCFGLVGNEQLKVIWRLFIIRIYINHYKLLLLARFDYFGRHYSIYFQLYGFFLLLVKFHASFINSISDLCQIFYDIQWIEV